MRRNPLYGAPQLSRPGEVARQAKCPAVPELERDDAPE